MKECIGASIEPAMRAVVQRVQGACVAVSGKVVGRISRGLAVLVAVHVDDTSEDLEFIKRRILNLRLFEDGEGRLNRSVIEEGYEILLVSQFTLYGDCRKGNRPSFTRAAPPGPAREMYERLLLDLSAQGIRVQAGEFQAMMKLSLVNDGPVTVVVDSRREFY